MNNIVTATPKISVVLAVYNGERHVEASVRSVLDQSAKDLEFIAIDDGSQDRTGEILARLRAADARVVVVRHENRGLAASLNRGIAMARGVYVARQDADDLSLPGRLALQAAELDRRPSLAALGSAAQVIDESGAVVGSLAADRGDGEVKRGLLSLRRTPVHGSMMIRRTALQEAGGYRESFPVGQDYDLWLRLSARSEIDNLTDSLYQWRLDPKGVYSTRRVVQLKYAAIALAFAHERTSFGEDSYALLTSCGGDLEQFVSRYRLAGFVYGRWGELLLRGVGNSKAVRAYLRRAVMQGAAGPRTLSLLVWSHLGLPWPGGKPLAHSEGAA